MSTSAEFPKNENTYFIDTESGAEMARLLDQDRLYTRGMGGLFAELSDLSGVNRVLDIACGPGGWIQEVAFAHPEIEAVGIDISETMIAYANAQVSVQKLDNARFLVMDATRPLDFPDHSFDLVNARLLQGFMPVTAWPTLLQECKRITRAGGIIRFTETEAGATTSPALEKLWDMLIQSVQRAGHTILPTGRMLGSTPMLCRFLREAGYQNVQLTAHALEYSHGTEFHYGFYQDWKVAFKLLQPYLISQAVTTQEEVNQLYEQMVREMLMTDFYGVYFLCTATGERP